MDFRDFERLMNQEDERRSKNITDPNFSQSNPPNNRRNRVGLILGGKLTPPPPPQENKRVKKIGGCEEKNLERGSSPKEKSHE